jgi:hypothetical protein
LWTLLLVGCGGQPLSPAEESADETSSIAATGWGVAGGGLGVNYRPSGGSGQNVFIGYAGYNLNDAQAQAWVDNLYASRLSKLNVGHLYAVRGPNDVGYSHREIGNTKLIAHLLGRPSPKLIVVAAHSSGSYVANELLGFLSTGHLDPGGKTLNNTVYFNLDGGGGMTADDANHLVRTYFVHSHDGRTGTNSPNTSTMLSQAATFAARASSLTLAADGDGCSAGATWCLHMTLINSRPHNAAGTDLRDYSDYVGRPVQTGYLDQTWAQLVSLATRP